MKCRNIFVSRKPWKSVLEITDSDFPDPMTPEAALARLTGLLAPYRALADSCSVDFIVSGLWEGVVPEGVRGELEAMTMEEVVGLPARLVAEQGVVAAEGTEVGALVAMLRAHSLEALGLVAAPEGEKERGLEGFDRIMPPKKQHEVEQSRLDRFQIFVLQQLVVGS